MEEDETHGDILDLLQIRSTQITKILKLKALTKTLAHRALLVIYWNLQAVVFVVNCVAFWQQER